MKDSCDPRRCTSLRRGLFSNMKVGEIGSTHPYYNQLSIPSQITNYQPITPYQDNPRTAPTAIAAAESTLNQVFSAFEIAAVTTYHGSKPTLRPLLLSAVR